MAMQVLLSTRLCLVYRNDLEVAVVVVAETEGDLKLVVSLREGATLTIKIQPVLNEPVQIVVVVIIIMIQINHNNNAISNG